MRVAVLVLGAAMAFASPILFVAQVRPGVSLLVLLVGLLLYGLGRLAGEVAG